MQYSTSDVAQLLGLTPQQIRTFVSAGLIRPARGTRGQFLFAFQDLILLRTAAALRAARISQRQMLRSLRNLKRQLPDGRELTEVRITAEGANVVVHDAGRAWNPASDQLVIDFDVAELAERANSIARLRFPQRADAQVNMGRLLHREGRISEAATHYRRALRFDPEHAIAAFNLGVAMEDLGRRRDAIQAYERCLGCDPNFADAHYNLAALLEKTGDQRGAIQHLAKYRTLHVTK